MVLSGTVDENVVMQYFIRRKNHLLFTADFVMLITSSTLISWKDITRTAIEMIYLNNLAEKLS